MEGILVNISNHPTLPIKRKQEVFCFKNHWGDETVEVFLFCRHFEKNEDDTYGERLNSKSIIDYESKLVASNSIKVDPTDGMELYPVVVQEKQEPTEENPEGLPEVTEWRRYDNQQAVQNFIGQFDFFDNIIRNHPIQIKSMLEQFIQLNDVAKGRWNK